MASIKLSLKQHDRSLKLIVSTEKMCHITSTSNVISEECNILNIANMYFKASQTADEMNINFETGLKKHELAKDMTVVLKITCKEMNFKAENICEEDWCWMLMTVLSIANLPEEPFEIDLKVAVRKTQSIINTKFYNDETLTDFHLSAKDGSVAVHRAYLAAHSDTFMAMFNGQWKETKENRIELKGVTRQTLKYFKEYIYLSTLPADNEALRPLLLLATQYLIESLKAECTMLILQTITAENLDSLVEFSSENGFHELLRSIHETIPKKVFAECYALRLKNWMSFEKEKK